MLNKRFLYSVIAGIVMQVILFLLLGRETFTFIIGYFISMVFPGNGGVD